MDYSTVSTKPSVAFHDEGQHTLKGAYRTEDGKIVTFLFDHITWRETGQVEQVVQPTLSTVIVGERMGELVGTEIHFQDGTVWVKNNAFRKSCLRVRTESGQLHSRSDSGNLRPVLSKGGLKFAPTMEVRQFDSKEQWGHSDEFEEESEDSSTMDEEEVQKWQLDDNVLSDVTSDSSQILPVLSENSISNASSNAYTTRQILPQLRAQELSDISSYALTDSMTSYSSNASLGRFDHSASQPRGSMMISEVSPTVRAMLAEDSGRTQARNHIISRASLALQRAHDFVVNLNLHRLKQAGKDVQNKTRYIGELRRSVGSDDSGDESDEVHESLPVLETPVEEKKSAPAPQKRRKRRLFRLGC